MDFTSGTYFTKQKLTEEMVLEAEKNLGRKLPESYLNLLREKNGGCPVRNCCPVPFQTSYANGYFAITAILGIGPDGVGEFGENERLISEWGYPDVGVVVCCTPSAGHDTVMLDYSNVVNLEDEPQVIYVDEDRIPRVVAKSFSDFLQMLIPEVPE